MGEPAHRGALTPRLEVELLGLAEVGSLAAGAERLEVFVEGADAAEGAGPHIADELRVGDTDAGEIEGASPRPVVLVGGAHPWSSVGGTTFVRCVDAVGASGLSHQLSEEVPSWR